MPFLKEEKSEHERARTPMLAVQPCCARHCELPLSKMGNKGLFPVVAVPRAFFGTFFRTERKYYPPRGGSPNVRAGVGASIPQMGFFTARSAYTAACRGLSARHLSPSVRSLKMESALWNDNTQPAPESARQSPGGIFLRPRALLVTKSVRPFPP